MPVITVNTRMGVYVSYQPNTSGGDGMAEQKQAWLYDRVTIYLTAIPFFLA